MSYEITRNNIWSCGNTSSYEAASLSWKRSIGLKCEQLAGSLNGYLDPRVAVEPGVADELWFAPPGSTLFGAYYAERISVEQLKEVMASYLDFLLDPDRLPVMYIDDDASFQRLSNIEAYTKFLHGGDKVLATDDLARKRFPRRHSQRPNTLESIASKCVSQFHQAWSIICGHLEQSTQHKVDQSVEIDMAKSDGDIVRILYELDLMGLRGNRSDSDVRKLYEDQLLLPDQEKIDQAAKYGSDLMGLTNYNNQSKRLYRSAMSLKSRISLERFIVGYFRGLHRNFNKTALYTAVGSFKSFQEAIDHVNLLADGLIQMNEGDWTEAPTNNTVGSKRENSSFYRRGSENFKSGATSIASSASSSSSSASGGYRPNGVKASPVLHTDVEEYCSDDVKEYINSTIAKSIEIYATGVANGGANSCSQWMNTGKCWRVEYLAKNPSMDQSQRCRYKHPDINSFVPPFK